MLVATKAMPHRAIIARQDLDVHTLRPTSFLSFSSLCNLLSVLCSRQRLPANDHEDEDDNDDDDDDDDDAEPTQRDFVSDQDTSRLPSGRRFKIDIEPLWKSTEWIIIKGRARYISPPCLPRSSSCLVLFLWFSSSDHESFDSWRVHLAGVETSNLMTYFCWMLSKYQIRRLV